MYGAHRLIVNSRPTTSASSAWGITAILLGVQAAVMPSPAPMPVQQIGFGLPASWSAIYTLYTNIQVRAEYSVDGCGCLSSLT